MQASELLNIINNYNICVDSRQINSNKDIYIAIVGAVDDGHKYISNAINLGASYVVANTNYDSNNDKIIHVENTQDFLLELVLAKYNTNKLKFSLVGITGTNGKTTITYILEHIYKSLNKKVGVLGTVNYRFADYLLAANLTTPGLLELHKFMAKMNENKVDIAFMEVSSHALEQKRVAGLEFSGAIFTNLTQDHLDYHKDMDSYFNAKAKLFLEVPNKDKVCVINANDIYGQKLLSQNENFVAYGLNIDCKKYKYYINAQIIENTPQGLKLSIEHRKEKFILQSKLCGEYNALNILAAITYALYSGLKVEDIKAIENFNGVSGRLEKIENKQGLSIFVDYAHTPDALINVQKALRAVGFKKLVTLFGCGGNRDKTKRPLMAKVVSEYADIAVLTSDNPREENPLDIIEDVKAGLTAKVQYVEADRKKAIHLAISLLTKDDVLLIAGKGHESYQIIGKTKYPFSDQQVVKEYLAL